MKILSPDKVSDDKLNSMFLEYSKDLFELAHSVEEVTLIKEAIEQIQIISREQGKRSYIREQEFIKSVTESGVIF